jgi:hypothetical protein
MSGADSFLTQQRIDPLPMIGMRPYAVLDVSLFNHLLNRAGAYAFCVLGTNRHHTIFVADNDVTGLDHHAIDRDRHIDFAWTVLVGASV